jgi:catechol 2,3-dioxygenase-like lactoylglutathione lyase family enzyme
MDLHPEPLNQSEKGEAMKTQWTHLALHVQSLEASIAFYERYTNLRIVDRHSDASSTGMEVAWLSDRADNDEFSFVMVLQEGTPRNVPGAKPQVPLGPISHLGFGLDSREEVDAIAAEAKKDGLLKFGPTLLNPYAGYLCIVSDPDGHTVEFSHGQALGKSPARSKSAAPAR